VTASAARSGSGLRAVICAIVAALFVLTATPAAAVPSTSSPDVIVLPGASSAEGIASGRGNTFYAGDFYRGDIFRGNLRTGTAELFIDVPDGRIALGMKYDSRTGYLYVAGGATGQGYVYDTKTGETVAVYQLAPTGVTTFVDDVALTRTGAWFTDANRAELYVIPLGRHGRPGPSSTSLPLTGPAADLSADFNLNGIVATPDGDTLIVGHFANGLLYTVDPTTGASAVIEGLHLPDADGLELRGQRLWVGQVFENQVSQVRLSRDFSSGVVEEVITSDLLQAPTTLIVQGNRLAVVNSYFNTGVPPTSDHYEVVVFRL
jgi:sugar lactone lactonase YvrE